MVRFPDDSATYRRSESETPETKRILEQINRVNINLGYIKPKPQPQLRFPNGPNGGGYNSGSFGHGFGNGGAYGNHHSGSSSSSGANNNAHTHYYSHDAFQSHYQGNNNNYVPSIRRSSDSQEATPRKIEPSHMVLVPNFVDLQTFVYPAHLLKSISLLDALKAFEPELMKSRSNESRPKTSVDNQKNSITGNRNKDLLNAIKNATNANGDHLDDKLVDKFNIILVTLKPKEESNKPKQTRTSRTSTSRTKKSRRKQKRQTKHKSKTIFTRPRPKPVLPSPSNIASILSKAPVTPDPGVRQDQPGAPHTVYKGPFAALFDRPNEVVEAIKEGGVIIQRLRVKNGGIAIAGFCFGYFWIVHIDQIVI